MQCANTLTCLSGVLRHLPSFVLRALSYIPDPPRPLTALLRRFFLFWMFSRFKERSTVAAAMTGFVKNRGKKKTHLRGGKSHHDRRRCQTQHAPVVGAFDLGRSACSPGGALNRTMPAQLMFTCCCLTSFSLPSICCYLGTLQFRRFIVSFV